MSTTHSKDYISLQDEAGYQRESSRLTRDLAVSMALVLGAMFVAILIVSGA